MRYIKCVTCGKIVTVKDEMCWMTTVAYWAGKGLETPEIRPTKRAADSPKSSGKSAKRKFVKAKVTRPAISG